MSFGSTVNKEKNGALLAYIAEKNPNIHLRKLLKIVYLIDEKFMELRGFPLTWFNYQAWEKGPVAPEVYAVKEGAFSSYVNCKKNQENKNIVTPVLQHDYLIGKQMEAYSLFEKEVIDSVIDACSEKSADDLTIITHQENALWSKIVEEQKVVFVDGKSDVEIPLTRLNEGNEEKTAIYEDALDYMQFCNATSPC
jgi:uncharacterized phage-associated protein